MVIRQPQFVSWISGTFCVDMSVYKVIYNIYIKHIMNNLDLLKSVLQSARHTQQ